MNELPNLLLSLLFIWVVITAVLIAMVAYRGTLSRMEDDSLYLNKAKEMILVSGEHDLLIARMNRLRRPIMALAGLSGILFLAGAALWLWTGYRSF